MLGIESLLGGWNLHTCCIFPFACEHFLNQRASCIDLVAFCSTFLFCIGLGLAWGFGFLYFSLDSSVHWCLIKGICVACISPATCQLCLAMVFELSYFLASWHTLLAGNLSKSTLPSFMIFETKSSSHQKNQNISLCKILAVSGGYFMRLTCACTLLYHSSKLLDPWKKLVNKSNLACTSLDWGLQNSSNCVQIVSNLIPL